MRSKDNCIKSLEENRARFINIVERAKASRFMLIKHFLYKKAIRHAVRSSTGIYNSPEIEEFYQSAANKIDVDLPDTYQPNSVLHVMSECYGVGGHSKVVQRWIKHREDDEMHSVYFTRMHKKDIPDSFYNIVDAAGGTIYANDSQFRDIKKASTLRRVAMKYQRIVLHIHMDDVIPLLAFGAKSFLRPVILYNHADHLFWVGSRIANLVCETRSWGMHFSEKNRGLKNSYVIGIPADDISFQSFKEIESVDNNTAEVITSIGMPHKYVELPGEYSFSTYMNSVLSLRKNVIFNIIGPTALDYPEWAALANNHEGRIFLPGRLVGDDYWKCIAKSTIVIDSFPMSGGTALGDVVVTGKPTLSLACVTGHLDYSYRTDSFCQSPQELLEKTLRLLDDRDYRTSLCNEVFAIYNSTENVSEWKCRVRQIYKIAENYKSSGESGHNKVGKLDFTALDIFILLFSLKERVLFSLGDKVTLLTFFSRGIRRFKFKFFNSNFIF